jgi:hypothetical protein
VVFPAGTPLTVAELPVLASLGIADVEVVRKVRVAGCSSSPVEKTATRTLRTTSTSAMPSEASTGSSATGGSHAGRD